MGHITKFKATENGKFGWASKNRVIFFVEFNQPYNPMCSFDDSQGRVSIPVGDRVEDNLVFDIPDLAKAETLVFMYLKANGKQIKEPYLL